MQNSLRYYRKRKGLKQTEVAEYLGLKDSSRICDWEAGKRLPNLKVLNKADNNGFKIKKDGH